MTKQLSTLNPIQLSRGQVEEEILASLPPRVVSSLESVCDKDFNVIACQIEGALSVEEIEQGIAVLEEAMRPLEPAALAAHLQEVYSLTKRRADDQIDLDFAILAYGTRLEAYPADIVAAVLTKWPDHSTWWPSWHELKTEIDWRNTRALIHTALVKKLNPQSSKTYGILKSGIRKM